MRWTVRPLPFAWALLLGMLLCTMQAQSADMRIVALGTSFTAGKGVGTNEAFPAKLEKLLREQGLAVQITNQGMNGNTTLDLLRRLDAAVPQGVSIAILEYALGNDRKRGLSTEDTVRNTSDIVARLMARNIRVLLVIRGANPGALARHTEWFHDTLAKYDMAYIAIEQPESTLQSDHQHPTAQAHGQIAGSMVAPLKVLVERASTTPAQ
jgi:lysophospholipase L1-like esterase